MQKQLELLAMINLFSQCSENNALIHMRTLRRLVTNEPNAEYLEKVLYCTMDEISRKDEYKTKDNIIHAYPRFTANMNMQLEFAQDLYNKSISYTFASAKVMMQYSESFVKHSSGDKALDDMFEHHLAEYNKHLNDVNQDETINKMQAMIHAYAIGTWIVFGNDAYIEHCRDFHLPHFAADLTPDAAELLH